MRALPLGLILLTGCPAGAPPDKTVRADCAESMSYVDADGDGYGGVETFPCAVASVTEPGDCDDADPARSPGRDEVCDDAAVDENCDGRGCAPSGDLAVDVLLTGQNEGDVLGTAMAIGDLDHDGDHELVLGAPHWENSSNTGAGALFVGELSGDFPTSLGDDERRVEGLAVSENLGASVLLLDDDGDGIVTLLTGAPGFGEPDSADGRVYRLEGPVSTRRTVVAADGVLAGSLAEQLGGVMVAGDSDGDGRSELAVGAWGGARVRVSPVDFGASADAASLPSWEGAGLSALAVGELDGDGLDDLVVGDSSLNEDQGVAWWISGPWTGGGVLDDADGRWDPGGVAVGLGTAVAAGDVDGDGAGEVLLGAPHEADGAGAVYVMKADAGGEVADGAVARLGVEQGGELGRGLAVLGDVDSNGVLDVGVGAPQTADGEGRVYLWYGPVSPGLAAGAEVSAGVPLGYFGMVVIGGDLDGDTIPELAALLPGDCCPRPPGSVGVVWGDR